MRDLGTLGVDNSSPSFIIDTGDIIGVADLTGSRHQNPHAILLRNRKRNVEKSDLGALKGDSYSPRVQGKFGRSGHPKLGV